MKGFVPTPPEIVDLMVGKLFQERAPDKSASVLDPGCGEGEFIAGILRLCTAQRWPVPRIVGVESEPERAATARNRFRHLPQVEIRHADFLQPGTESFDFVIGNPPYVPITSLTPGERLAYRAEYRTANGRFDLYVLFFEQALRLLAPGGRLVFITPEKFLYVETARRLRELLRRHQLEEMHFVSETTFGKRVTYPLISTVSSTPRHGFTRVVRRNGAVSQVVLPATISWLPAIEGLVVPTAVRTLADVTLRISCGVATGADRVFVMPTADLTPELQRFALPTVSGRQITPSGALTLRSSLLAPYDENGKLLPENRLGPLGRFLSDPVRRQQLEGRTCVIHKPWYAFHDNLPLEEMRRPKLLCKDITEEPFFIVDSIGELVPRHSVYYIVPADPADLQPLAEYLNSREARAWLHGNCQRAANNFIRLQSHVLKRMPVPECFAARTESDKIDPAQAELLPA